MQEEFCSAIRNCRLAAIFRGILAGNADPPMAAQRDDDIRQEAGENPERKAAAAE